MQCGAGRVWQAAHVFSDVFVVVLMELFVADFVVFEAAFELVPDAAVERVIRQGARESKEEAGRKDDDRSRATHSDGDNDNGALNTGTVRPVLGRVASLDARSRLCGGFLVSETTGVLADMLGEIFRHMDGQNLGHGILPDTPIAHVERMLVRVRAAPTGA